MKKNIRYQSGFTLLELLIAMVIGSMILATIINLQMVSFNAFGVQSKNYRLQNNVKNSMEQMANVLKKSTSVWPLDNTKFNPSTFDPLNPPTLPENKSRWNYVAVSADKKSINNYIWNEAAKRYDIVSLTSPSPTGNQEIFYDVNYFLNTQGKNINQLTEGGIFNFTITGEYKTNVTDSSKNPFSLTSNVSMDNTPDKKIPTLYASDPNKITAFAYMQTGRKDTVKTNAKKALVIFVADNSGSMNFGLGVLQDFNYYNCFYIIFAGKKYYINDKYGNYVNNIIPGQKYYYTIPQRNFLGPTDKTTYYNGIYYIYLSNGWQKIYNKKDKLATTLDIGEGPFYYFTGKSETIEASDSIFTPRITTLRSKYQTLVESMSNSGLNEFTMLRFSSESETRIIYSTNKLSEDLDNAKLANTQLVANGGTNLGWGLNVAYDEFNQSIYNDYKKYLVVLTDGVPTMYVSEGIEYGGQETEDNIKMAKDYIEEVSDGNSRGIDATFLIGFSGIPKDVSELENIRDILKNKCSNTTSQVASSAAELEMAFEIIKNSINEDMWYYLGP